MMAFSLGSCLVLAFCLSLALAVLDKPCNSPYTDCDAGECCATATRSPEGFKGTCQKLKMPNEECNPEGPKDGECKCVGWTICAKAFLEEGGPEKYTCHILLPGR